MQVISWVFKRILVATEDSDLKYRNPFVRFWIFSILEQEARMAKAIFTPEQMRKLIEPIPDKYSRTNVYRVVHEVFYVLFMTGWRVS